MAKTCSSLALCLFVVAACAVLFVPIPAALAGPVPGDPNPIQTEGMCFATYGFTVNTTTYSNVTLDVHDISDLVNKCRENDFALALDVWVNGSNSYRNLNGTATRRRIAKSVVENTFTDEDWYTAAIDYFANDPYLGGNVSRYLGKYIEDALRGEGMFSNMCKGVRAAVVKAGMLFYPLLYFYHEVDAAVKTMRGINAGTTSAEAINRLNSGFIEAQDAWACYYAPNAAYGQRNPVIAAGNTFSGSRVATGYNAWDVQISLDRFFSDQYNDSLINQKMLALSKVIYKRIARGLAKTLDADKVAGAVTAIRLEQQLLLNLRQVQLTVKAIYEACQGSGTPTWHCSDCSKGKQLWAAAWTHWRLAEPTFRNKNLTDSLGTTPVTVDKLVGVRDMLHPDRVEASKHSPSRTQCNDVYNAIQGIMNSFGYSGDYSWASVMGRRRNLWA